MSERSNRVLASLMVFAATLMFASKGIIVKLAYAHEVDSLSLLTLRMVFAFPFFVLLWFLNYRKSPVKKILKIKIWKVIILGVLGYHVASYFSFLGISMITASMERVLLTTYPTMVVLLSYFVLRKKIYWQQSIALFLTYTGIIIAFSQGLMDSAQDNFLFGGSLVLMCAFSYAVYMVFAGELIPLIGSQLFNATSLLAACITIFLHYLVSNSFIIQAYSSTVLGYGFVLALFSTVIPTMMFTEGIRRMGSNNAAIITSMGPICTIMLAYVILGESLNIYQWLGTALVVGGVTFVVLNKETITSKPGNVS